MTSLAGRRDMVPFDLANEEDLPTGTAASPNRGWGIAERGNGVSPSTSTSGGDFDVTLDDNQGRHQYDVSSGAAIQSFREGCWASRHSIFACRCNNACPRR
jgi:hypothetical protein